MKIISQNRKIIMAVGASLLISVVLLISAPAVLAQGTPATPSVGSGISDALKGVATPALWVVNLILRTTLGLMSLILSAASYILGEAFSANINLNPANMEVVRIGWRITRDLSNSFFLLIILWIALTIIFNIEQFGGRKLLGKVIIVALLINFSLVMVTVVFGFANLVAQQFAKEIKTADVGGIFVEATRVNTVTASLTPSETAELKTYYNYNTSSLGFPGNAQAPGFTRQWGFKDTLLASVGIERTEAQVGTGLAGCGIGAIFGGPIGCALGGIAGAAAGALWGKLTAGFNYAFSNALALAMGNIVMLMAVVALLYAALALVLRMVVEVLLSVFAPLALLLWAVPSPKVSQYWNMWLSYLLRWAFFAPAFYFLFYLTLLMLQKYNEAVKVKTVASGDWDRILQILVAGVLIIAAVRLAKATGGVVADTVIGWGKALALGAITGGAGFAAGLATRRFAPQIRGGIQRVSRMPALGKLAAPVLERGEAYVEKQLKKADEVYEKVKDKSTEQLVSGYLRSTFAHDKAGHIRALAERGKLGELERAGVSSQDMLTIMRRFGREENVLKTRLDLASPTQLTEVLNKMRAEDYARLSAESLRGPRGAAVLRELVPRLEAHHLQRIAQENPELRQEINMGLAREPALVSQLRPHTYQYVVSQPAQSLGYRLPAGAAAPTEAGEELRTRISEMRSRAARLRALGSVREAERIERVDIPELEDRLRRMGLTP